MIWQHWSDIIVYDTTTNVIIKIRTNAIFRKQRRKFEMCVVRVHVRVDVNRNECDVIKVNE